MSLAGFRPLVGCKFVDQPISWPRDTSDWRSGGSSRYALQGARADLLRHVPKGNGINLGRENHIIWIRMIFPSARCRHGIPYRSARTPQVLDSIKRIYPATCVLPRVKRIRTFLRIPDSLPRFDHRIRNAGMAREFMSTELWLIFPELICWKSHAIRTLQMRWWQATNHFSFDLAVPISSDGSTILPDGNGHLWWIDYPPVLPSNKST